MNEVVSKHGGVIGGGVRGRLAGRGEVQEELNGP